MLILSLQLYRRLSTISNRIISYFTIPFCSCLKCLHKSFTDCKNPSVGYCEKRWSLAYKVLTSVADFATRPDIKNISPHEVKCADGKPATFAVKSSKLKLKWKFCAKCFPLLQNIPYSERRGWRHYLGLL